MADRPVFLYAAVYDEIADAEADTKPCSTSTPTHLERKVPGSGSL